MEDKGEHRSGQERRQGQRRSGKDHRKVTIPVAVERRKNTTDRRSNADRRSGFDRRKGSGNKSVKRGP